MKEQDLIDLGFKRYNISAEESGDKPFFYFTYNITDELCLISTNNDVDAGKITAARDVNITADNNISINDNITTGQDLLLTTTNNDIQISNNFNNTIQKNYTYTLNLETSLSSTNNYFNPNTRFLFSLDSNY